MSVSCLQVFIQNLCLLSWIRQCTSCNSLVLGTIYRQKWSNFLQLQLGVMHPVVHLQRIIFKSMFGGTFYIMGADWTFVILHPKQWIYSICYFHSCYDLIVKPEAVKFSGLFRWEKTLRHNKGFFRHHFLRQMSQASMRTYAFFTKHEKYRVNINVFNFICFLLLKM